MFQKKSCQQFSTHIYRRICLTCIAWATWITCHLENTPSPRHPGSSSAITKCDSPIIRFIVPFKSDHGKSDHSKATGIS